MSDEHALPNDEPQADNQDADELQAEELDQVVGGTAPFLPGGAVLSAATNSSGVNDGESPNG